MRINQKSFIIAGLLFILFLISYKYSLYQDVSFLPYLNDLTTITAFQRIFTYIFMMIGVPPTMLIILYTSYLCQTGYPNNVVQITCFGSPFSLSGSEGFFAYVVASLLVTGALWYLYFLLFPHKMTGKQK